MTVYNYYSCDVRGLICEDDFRTIDVEHREAIVELPSLVKFMGPVALLKQYPDTGYYYLQILFFMGQLIKECAYRMPTECANQMKEPHWFFIGKKVIALIDKELQTVKGFRIMEEKEDNLKLICAFVDRSYRRQGVYSKLMLAAKRYALEKNLTYLTVALDSGLDNPMHDLLGNMGFQKDTINDGVSPIDTIFGR